MQITGINSTFLTTKKCTCDKQNSYKIKILDVLADRMCLLIITDNVPPYMFSARLATLSKTKTMVADEVSNIRPIGIVSILTKIAEKTFKFLIEDSGYKLF